MNIPPMRHLLAIPAASLFFILNCPAHAQTNTGAPAQEAAPSPSGTGPTSAVIRTVSVHTIGIDGKEVDVMQLGTEGHDQPGVLFITGEIKAPPGFPGGKLFWLQVCVPNRWRQDNAGHWTHLTSDSPCIDKNAPASFGTHGDAISSPRVILDPDFQVQTVYDEYTTFLMYQSDTPQSIPVPLLSYWWYWTGVSTRTGTKWTLSNAGTSGNPRPNAHPDMPSWSGMLDALGYK